MSEKLVRKQIPKALLRWPKKNYNFFSPYPTEAKFGVDWPSISWKEDVNRWQPIAIGHLSDSGELRTKKNCS